MKTLHFKHFALRVSVIELAIIIVTLALFFGTIFSGMLLIKNAKINAMMNQMYKYKATFQIFKLRYYEIPGDIKDASKVIQGVGEDQNGNGDGKISFSENNYGETYLPWVHLEKAGFITSDQGQPYSGKPCCDYNNWGTISYSDQTINLTPNVARPSLPTSISFKDKTKIPVYMFFYSTGVVTGNKLALSWSVGDNNRPFYGPILPAELQNIDEKYDDGLPLAGNIIGTPGNIPLTNAQVKNNPIDTCMNGDSYLTTRTNSLVEGCVLVLNLE